MFDAVGGPIDELVACDMYDAALCLAEEMTSMSMSEGNGDKRRRGKRNNVFCTRQDECDFDVCVSLVCIDVVEGRWT